MIEIFVVAALLQAAPATEESFGFYCKTEGTFSSEQKLSAFPQKRPIAILVRRTKSGYLTPLRTADPSALLAGKPITRMWTDKERPMSYSAVTSLPSADSDALTLSFQPSNSTKFNEWTIAIGRSNSDKLPPLTIGKCLLMDGISEAQFDALILKFGEPK